VRYELVKRSGMKPGRVVAVGSREAVLAAARLYGGRNTWGRDERATGDVDSWEVEGRGETVWLTMSTRSDGWEGFPADYYLEHFHRQVLETLPESVQNREFWNKPLREGVESGRLTPIFDYPFHCQLCGNQTRDTKSGMRFCKSCDDPVPRNYMSRLEELLP